MEEIEDTLTVDGEKLKKGLDELVTVGIYVGFKAGEKFEENGVDVVDVAYRNEFGDDRVPSRPFMAQTVDNREPEIMGIVKKSITENDDINEIARLIGEGVALLMKDEIETGNFVPNAPSTIARKGSDKPLIDTGTMRDSIMHWTEKG